MIYTFDHRVEVTTHLRLTLRRKPNVELDLTESVRGSRLERLDGADTELLSKRIGEALIDGGEDAELARRDLLVLDALHVHREVVNEVLARRLVHGLVIESARLLEVELGDGAELVARETNKGLVLDLLVVVNAALVGQRCDRALVVRARSLCIECQCMYMRTSKLSTYGC